MPILTKEDVRDLERSTDREKVIDKKGTKVSDLIETIHKYESDYQDCLKQINDAAEEQFGKQ